MTRTEISRADSPWPFSITTHDVPSHAPHSRFFRSAASRLKSCRYLETPPDEASLRELLGQLGMTPLELMRRGEARYRELGLKAADVSDDDRVRAMAENPILIERPIFIAGGKAIVGRPPERVLELL